MSTTATGSCRENGADGYHVSAVHWNYAATTGGRKESEHVDNTRAMSADAAPGGGADDGAYGGVETGALCGAEPAGDLAIGGGGPEFALAAIVVGGHLGMVEESEEVLAQLAVARSQSLAVSVRGSERHDGVERVFETVTVFAAGALCQPPMPPGQHHGSQEQRKRRDEALLPCVHAA